MRKSSLYLGYLGFVCFLISIIAGIIAIATSPGARSKAPVVAKISAPTHFAIADIKFAQVAGTKDEIVTIYCRNSTNPGGPITFLQLNPSAELKKALLVIQGIVWDQGAEEYIIKYSQTATPYFIRIDKIQGTSGFSDQIYYDVKKKT